MSAAAVPFEMLLDELLDQIDEFDDAPIASPRDYRPPRPERPTLAEDPEKVG